MEKIVCANVNLKIYDNLISNIYINEFSSTHSEELKKTQKAWLRRRNACSDLECVTAKYDERLSFLFKNYVFNVSPTEDLDPTSLAWDALFPDNHVTCEKLHQIPLTIFSFGGLDLGSGHGSPIEVDYACPGGLSSAPFMAPLLKLAEDIRSENGPQWCTGSIVHAQWRYYNYSLLQAGLAPTTLKLNQYTDKLLRLSRLWSYFDAWGTESPFNYRLQQEFLRVYNTTLPLLTEYYQRKSLMQQSEAEELAAEALLHVVYRAIGSFPGSSEDSGSTPVQLSKLAAQVKGNPEDLKEVLSLIEKSTQAERYQTLKLALANESPLVL